MNLKTFAVMMLTSALSHLHGKAQQTEVKPKLPFVTQVQARKVDNLDKTRKEAYPGDLVLVQVTHPKNSSRSVFSPRKLGV